MPDVSPLISVIIPVYNREVYLGDAVASVLATGYPKLEVMVVDDGSRDGSVEVAQLWQSRYPDVVRVLRHPDGANHGISATRNLGITQSHGEFIAFLDSDDIFLSNRFGYSIPELGRCPELLAVYEPVVSLQDCADFVGKSRDHALLAGLPKQPPEGEFDSSKVFQKLLYGYYSWNTPGITLRREAFVDVGMFREEFSTSEDTHLWLRLAATERVRCAQDKEPVASVRSHARNVSASVVSDQRDLLMLKVYVDVYRGLGTGQGLFRAMMKGRINSFMGELALRSHGRRSGKVFRLFAEMLRIWPRGILQRNFLVNFLAGG